jgi:hypothetical protein
MMYWIRSNTEDDPPDFESHVSSKKSKLLLIIYEFPITSNKTVEKCNRDHEAAVVNHSHIPSYVELGKVFTGCVGSNGTTTLYK